MNKKIEEIKEVKEAMKRYSATGKYEDATRIITAMPYIIAECERLESENDIVAKANEKLHKNLDELQDEHERLDAELDLAHKEFDACDSTLGGMTKDWKAAKEKCERLEKENERLEFLLQQEKDAYGMDVINILDAVQEGRISKMKAHQRLNKYYKTKYKKES